MNYSTRSLSQTNKNLLFFTWIPQRVNTGGTRSIIRTRCTQSQAIDTLIVGVFEVFDRTGGRVAKWSGIRVDGAGETIRC